MFGGRIDDAAEAFTRAASSFRAGGDHVRGLTCDISVAHAFNSGRRSPEAAELVDDLVVRARATGNPTVLCWGLLVGADAIADVDADRALAGYSAAIAHGSLVDNRLFVALARASGVALMTRHGDAAAALEAFDRILAQWEDGANEAVQWGTLLHLAELLTRVGAERDGALVAGAVLAARRRRPTIPRDDARLAETVDHIRARIGGTATENALTEGADMALEAAVAHARRMIRARRARFGCSSPPGAR
jgi:hypothetical protein